MDKDSRHYEKSFEDQVRKELSDLRNDIKELASLVHTSLTGNKSGAIGLTQTIEYQNKKYNDLKKEVAEIKKDKDDEIKQIKEQMGNIKVQAATDISKDRKAGGTFAAAVVLYEVITSLQF